MVNILLKQFKPLNNQEIRSIKEAAKAYGKFINMPVSIEKCLVFNGMITLNKEG